MKQINASDLKTILHSKRANLYYIEHCRVLVNGGRVEYVTDEGKHRLYWNIPIANTTSILLGTGTSITQAAMRELSKAGVLVGFCGGGGTPLYSGSDFQIDVSWLTPQSEYRPTEYLQRWVYFWFDETKRLEAAKTFQLIRLQQIESHWLSARMQREERLQVSKMRLTPLLNNAKQALNNCKTTNDILVNEAQLTKNLYKLAAKSVHYGEFVRAKRGSGTDLANRFLDHGNYLAYGLAATAAWVTGLPHGLPVLHGKTRRGALVFDLADLMKDALILPQAFLSAMAGEEEQEFRNRCIELFNRAHVLDVMIDAIDEVTMKLGTVSS